jgi:hypothetical protein
MDLTTLNKLFTILEMKSLDERLVFGPIWNGVSLVA